eukprot:m.23806 g.23806  ORF g.23806 m.23806 type:complete len:592 (+) comp7541_c0_seq1:303-2078(+)
MNMITDATAAPQQPNQIENEKEGGEVNFVDYDSRPEIPQKQKEAGEGPQPAAKDLLLRRLEFSKGKYSSQGMLQQREDRKNYLYDIYREDLAEWFAALFPIDVTPANIIDEISSGVLLCQLACLILKVATPETWRYKAKHSDAFTPPKFTKSEQRFKTRDNIHNFIVWATQMGVPCVFETNDLSLTRNVPQVLNCLMDVARGAQDCLDRLPTLVTFEQQHEDMQGNESPDKEEPQEDNLEVEPQLEAKNDIGEVARMERDDKGRYIFRDQKLFVRCFNRHVVVRVGGGWDTLKHYLTDVVHMDTETADELVRNVVEDFEQTDKKPKKKDGGNDFNLHVRTAADKNKEKLAKDKSKDIVSSKSKTKAVVKTAVEPRKKQENSSMTTGPSLSETFTVDAMAAESAGIKSAVAKALATPRSAKLKQSNLRTQTPAKKIAPTPAKKVAPTPARTPAKSHLTTRSSAPTPMNTAIPMSARTKEKKQSRLGKSRLQVAQSVPIDTVNTPTSDLTPSDSESQDVVRNLIMMCGLAQSNNQPKAELLVNIGFQLGILKIPDEEKSVLLHLAQHGNFGALTRIISKKRLNDDDHTTVTEL